MLMILNLLCRCSSLALGILAAFAVPVADASAQELTFDAGRDSIELPLVMLSNGNYPGLPCIEVAFAGQKRLFLLDTGFNGVAVDPGLAKELALEQRGTDIQAGIGGVSRVPLFRAPALEFDGARFTAPLFHGLDLTGFSGGRAQPLAGILGGQFIGSCVLTIDYGRHLVRIVDRETFEPPEGQAATKLDFFVGQPEVWASLDGGRRMRFLLDTGAELCLVLHEPFVARHELAADSDRLCESRVRGLNGLVVSHSASFARFTIGEVEFTNASAILLGATKGISLGGDARRAGVIGSAMLRGMSVTFDYKQRRLFWARIAGSEAGEVSGLTMDWDDPKHVVVLGVMTWAARPSIDIEPDDVLCAVDGGALPEGPGAFYSLLRSKAEVVLTIERDGKRHDVKWQRIDELPRVAIPGK
jgi:predicted aspartyl protease